LENVLIIVLNFEGFWYPEKCKDIIIVISHYPCTVCNNSNDPLISICCDSRIIDILFSLLP